MRRIRHTGSLLVLILSFSADATVWALAPPAANGLQKTTRVEFKLRTGGQIAGALVDHSEDALVIVSEMVPYAFAWEELEPGSAYATYRQITAFERNGGPLGAEDHFRLGAFALRQDRRDLAADAFRKATKADDRLVASVRSAYEGHARRTAAFTIGDGDNGPDQPDGIDERSDAEGSAPSMESSWNNTDLASGPTDDARKKVMAAYRTFGAKVQEVLGRSIVPVESEHFLIWTDWAKPNRHRLVDWCESMYRALAVQFGVADADHLFLAKCPVFCFRGKKRFQRFAQYFDGYEGAGAVGYTRSIEANGHVHVVLLRHGRSVVDFDAFASTLVHEGTHAFLHRLYTPRLIPHWVNEGIAELMAERVLGPRCGAGEKAALLARQFARYDWPIDALLGGTGPIGVHEYPIAHSVMNHLARKGPEKLAAFVRGLKSGETVPAALAAAYDGLSLAGLEREWRAAVLDHGPDTGPAAKDP